MSKHLLTRYLEDFGRGFFAMRNSFKSLRFSNFFRQTSCCLLVLTSTAVALLASKISWECSPRSLVKMRVQSDASFFRSVETRYTTCCMEVNPENVLFRTLSIQVCSKKGISPTIVFWGWDLDHQSYCRDGSGFLGELSRNDRRLVLGV